MWVRVCVCMCAGARVSVHTWGHTESWNSCVNKWERETVYACVCAHVCLCACVLTAFGHESQYYHY